MTREEIESRVREVLVRTTGAEPASVGPGFHQESSAGWTSLSHLMLVSELESEFGVTFAGSEVLKLVSWERIVGALADRLADGR